MNKEMVVGKLTPATGPNVQLPEPKEPRKCLCFRCEYRARFLETGFGPRYECGGIQTGSYCCYMYQPVRPCVLKPQKGDRRPRFSGAMISAREQFAGIADGEYELMKGKAGAIVWYHPNGKVKKEK